jgi:hypothetical protein
MPIFSHNITSLVILDKEFNFVRVNKVYAESCQRDILKFAGHNHYKFFPRDGNRQIFEEAVRSKSSYETSAKPFDVGIMNDESTKRKGLGLLSIWERLKNIGGRFEIESAEGHTTKQIGLRLHISSKTVEAHRLRIMNKLDIDNIAQLTKYAIQEGLTMLES